MELKKISDRYYQAKSTKGNDWYDVFIDRGKYSCTCNDFVFRGAGRTCKHINAALADLGGAASVFDVNSRCEPAGPAPKAKLGRQDQEAEPARQAPELKPRPVRRQKSEGNK